MRIGISNRPIVGLSKTRGVGTYTRLLIESLQKYETQHSYTIFTHEKELPLDIEVVHYPFFDPFFLTLPLIKRKPTVVTVHDLIPIVFPNHFPKGVRGNVKWMIQKLSLKKASRIITDSRNSKQDILRVLGYDSSRVDVIPLAPAPEFLAKKHSKQTMPFPVSTPYFLYVGDINWNKNVIAIINAFSKLPRGSASLIFVGTAFSNHSLPEAKEIMREIHRLSLGDSIQMPGFVENEDLLWLYQHAEALILASRYEGFGLPVVEAFAAGCVVIATNNSSLSEVIGPAIQVSETVESIVKAMQTVLSLPNSQKEQLKKEGRAYSQTFSWKTVVRQTVESYEKAIHHHSGI